MGPVRHVLVAVVAVGTIAVQNTSSLHACGDKFLLVGRGVSYHRAYAAVHPASIVVFADSQRSAAKAISDPKFQTELKQAGHHVLLVQTDAALAKALESDKVDLVLTDVADAERTSKQAAAAPSAPAVLPVMYEPTKEEVKAVEATYHCRLQSSDRVDRYLVTIDDAMKARADVKKK